MGTLGHIVISEVRKLEMNYIFFFCEKYNVVKLEGSDYVILKVSSKYFTSLLPKVNFSEWSLVSSNTHSTFSLSYLSRLI